MLAAGSRLGPYEILTPLGAGGMTFESDVPRPLFETRVGSLNPDYRNQYAVSSDGSRFLVNVVSEGSSSSQITVVLNWTEMLKK